jgi:predicted TIM-barrel fold metal-dependent hydrolase
MFPAFIQADLSSEYWLSVFSELERLHSTVLLSYEFLLPPKTLTIDQYLAQLDVALTHSPDLRVALLHAGCIDPLKKEAEQVVRLVKRHPNLYLSNAMPGAVWDDGCEYPFPNLLARVKTLRDAVGADRLMYATDWPWFEDECKYKQSIDCFRLHAPFLSKQELDAFLGGTAQRFVGDL